MEQAKPVRPADMWTSCATMSKTASSGLCLRGIETRRRVQNATNLVSILPRIMHASRKGGPKPLDRLALGY